MKKGKSPFSSFEPVRFDLDSLDLGASLGNLPQIHRQKIFLKRFTPDELMKIIRKVGLSDHLDSMGFHNCIIDVDQDESYINYLKLYYSDKSPDNLLLDLRVSETKFTPKKELLEMGFENKTYDMVVIEWLSAQNPKSRFDQNKPQLPGQRRPGLGILKYCFDMMYIVAREVIKDGFMDIPDHMHGAIMYSKKFKFYNPVHEAILQAILRDLSDHSMLDISWGMLTDTVYDEKKGESQAYDPSEQIFYVSERLRRHFNSKAYRSIFSRYYKKKRYRLDYDEMVRKRDRLLKTKQIVDI
ncbi:MAG: hypothetical protein JXA20_20155 [Spirochaetes bacterium]|nr:hypothetical protein [Spirochaetota bacterium]